MNSDTIVDARSRNTESVIAAIELVPGPDKRKALLEVLHFVEERVLTNPECLACGVFEAADRTQRILYEEQWRTAKDLHAHIRSRLYLSILQAMELACEEPRISFHEVSRTRSMDLIEELRSVGKVQQTGDVEKIHILSNNNY